VYYDAISGLDVLAEKIYAPSPIAVWATSSSGIIAYQHGGAMTGGTIFPQAQDEFIRKGWSLSEWAFREFYSPRRPARTFVQF